MSLDNATLKTTQIVINSPISIDDVPVSNGINNATEELPKIIVDIIESIKTEAQIAIRNNTNIFSEEINLDLLRYNIFTIFFFYNIYLIGYLII